MLACFRVVRTFHSLRVMTAKPEVPLVAVWACIGALLAGCPDPVGNKMTAGPEALSTPPATDPPPNRKNARYIKIRDLLRKGTEDAERATQLYTVVHPVCVDDDARREFLEVAEWSASFSEGDQKLTVLLAIDTLEYVATTCFSTNPEGALALLDGAQAFIPDEPRLAIIRARLYQADGRLQDALRAVDGAVRAGSVHALALKANIQAKIERSKGVGYETGMLDEAIKTVSVTPQAHWRAIDLAAILSTKARLLWERAAWEDEKKARATLAEADAIFERLSVPPFLEQMRLRALDNLCYDEVVTGSDERHQCRRAALKGQILGAAAAAGFPPDPERFDEPRRQRILAALETWQTLPKGAAVVLIGRGDEAELLEWTRPTARLLGALFRADLRLVVVDRTRSERASALLDRMVKLSRVKATEVLRVGRNPLAMPCIAAILDRRQLPPACPLAPEQVTRLERIKPYGTSLLVGRDLDAELDDLALYELDATLLSFRLSRLKKPVHAWLKSVSDIFLLVP